MNVFDLAAATSALAPAVFMLLAAFLPGFVSVSTDRVWRGFTTLSFAALAGLLAAAFSGASALALGSLVKLSPLSLGLALLVQLLGTVIGRFSARYLQGEAGQRRYVTALAAVLTAVHLLLIADHWVILIAAWALVGVALQRLLCFYPDRPFAMLAAHKKRIADRLADVLLIGAAALAWSEVGSGSLSALWAHLGREGMSASLHVSAVCLVLAVTLRVALLPVHGWLIQVMEAPTPVSALLHAGVVNLGGEVLIRFAPLLEQAMPARALLIAFGLATAILAGLVMLTRISIKVRLAWSTVAQMGFMVLECGLGLYTFAALHLIGHSLYKAHAFLSASTVVRETRLQAMRSMLTPAPLSLLLAPVVAICAVLLLQSVFQNPNHAAWPWWWSAVLGLAWAPLLWMPTQHRGIRGFLLHGLSGLLMVTGLTAAALLMHALPLGIHDDPSDSLGMMALAGMAALYLCLVILQLRPQTLEACRRWSYAGFYVDEITTRLALQLWPARWTPDPSITAHPRTTSWAAADSAQ